MQTDKEWKENIESILSTQNKCIDGLATAVEALMNTVDILTQQIKELKCIPKDRTIQ